MNNLFVPKNLRVGYQNRNDTYTGKLAYIIYYDEKNNLRKETSFNRWVEKEGVKDMLNEPQNGYIFNKGVKRFGHFNNNNTKFRIYDPRGFEFEITTSNFTEIMKYSDILKQEIQQECILGWEAGELVLIPTNSDLYVEAKKYSDSLFRLKNEKIQLELGKTYKSKTKSSLIYLGKFNVNQTKVEYSHNYNHNEFMISSVQKKQDVFFNTTSRVFDFVNKNTLIEKIDDIKNIETDDLLKYFAHFNELNNITELSLVNVENKECESAVKKVLAEIEKSDIDAIFQLLLKTGNYNKSNFGFMYLKDTDLQINFNCYNNLNIRKVSVNENNVKLGQTKSHKYQQFFLKQNEEKGLYHESSLFNALNKLKRIKDNFENVNLMNNKQENTFKIKEVIAEILGNIEYKTVVSSIFNNTRMACNIDYLYDVNMFTSVVPKTPYSEKSMLTIPKVIKVN